MRDFIIGFLFLVLVGQIQPSPLAELAESPCAAFNGTGPEIRIKRYPGCPKGPLRPSQYRIHLEIPGDCNHFIHCDNYGVGVCKICAPSPKHPLVFDRSVDDQECSWPWDSKRRDCGRKPKPPPTSTETPEPTTATTPCTPIPTKPPPPPSPCAAYNGTGPAIRIKKYPGCPRGPLRPSQYRIHLEIAGDCNHFIHCDNYGVGVCKVCAPSPKHPLVFDRSVNDQECSWPWDSKRRDCGRKPKPPPTRPETSDSTIASTPCTPEPTRPPPQNPCAAYNGTGPEIRIKNYPGCPRRHLRPSQYRIHLEIPGDCNHFIHCDNYGVGVCKICAPSPKHPLVFDRSVNDQECSWPWDSKRRDCGRKPKPPPTSPETPEPTTATSPSTPKPTRPPPPSPCAAYNGTGPAIQIRKYPGCPRGALRPSQYRIHLEIPGDCNHFIHCDNFGVGVCKVCAPSPKHPLVFDRSVNDQECSWPWDSKRKDC